SRQPHHVYRRQRQRVLLGLRGAVREAGAVGGRIAASGLPRAARPVPCVVWEHSRASVRPELARLPAARRREPEGQSPGPADGSAGDDRDRLVHPRCRSLLTFAADSLVAESETSDPDGLPTSSPGGDILPASEHGPEAASSSTY